MSVPQFKYTKQSIGYRGGPKASGLSLNDSHSTANPRHPLFLFDRSLLGPVGLRPFQHAVKRAPEGKVVRLCCTPWKIFSFLFEIGVYLVLFFRVGTETSANQLTKQSEHRKLSDKSSSTRYTSCGLEYLTLPTPYDAPTLLQKDPPSSDDFFRPVLLRIKEIPKTNS